jgi:hypothetical protein
MKMANDVSNCKCIIWKMSFGCGLFRAKVKASILAAFMKWAKRSLWQGQNSETKTQKGFNHRHLRI